MLRLPEALQGCILPYLDVQSAQNLEKALGSGQAKDPNSAALLQLFKDATFWAHLHKENPQSPYKKQVVSAQEYYADLQAEIEAAAYFN